MKNGSTWDANFVIRARFQDDIKSLCGDFENFDFRPFLSGQRSKIGDFPDFWQNFDL